MTEQSCASCKYAFTKGQPVNTVLCRRFPPSIVVMPQGALVLFPSMQKTGWCGEYALKLELTS